MATDLREVCARLRTHLADHKKWSKTVRAATHGGDAMIAANRRNAAMAQIEDSIPDWLPMLLTVAEAACEWCEVLDEMEAHLGDCESTRGAKLADRMDDAANALRRAVGGDR